MRSSGVSSLGVSSLGVSSSSICGFLTNTIQWRSLGLNPFVEGRLILNSCTVKVVVTQ